LLRASLTDSMYYYQLLANRLEGSGDHARALAYRDSIVRLAHSRVLIAGPSPQSALGPVVQAHAALGNRDQALHYLAPGDSVTSARPGNQFDRCLYCGHAAAVMAILGNRDSAVTLVERQLSEPCGRTPEYYRAMGPLGDVVVNHLQGYRPFEQLLSR
jgi:hypothetical protein